VFHVVGKQDDRHPAPGQLALDGVAAREGGSKTLDEISQ